MLNCTPIQVKLTMLVENEARGRGLIGEHGLSYHLKVGKSNILFDCGQGMALPHNADKLGIQFREISHIILSHGHYDHCGGLPSVLKENTTASIWMHPLATQAKFSSSGGKMHRVSEPFMEAKRFTYPEREICFIEKPTEIVPGLWATGTVPRENNYEDTGGAFYLDSKGEKIDPIHDDMSIFFKSKNGLIVILGCAHAGIINTLKHILKITGETKIHTVIGGMHLLHASDERIQTTLKEFQQMQIEYMGPCHCTGVKPIHAIHQAWGHEKFIHCHAGMKCVF